MRLLFLRGQVPIDRDPRQIMYDRLENNCDMWTQLFHSMTDKIGGYGEIWYWGGNREKKYTDNFVERWMGSFKHNRKFDPDVIFARGGFPEYDTILDRYPKAFKIYYGAGKRTYPRHKFKDYQLILNDTPEQLVVTKSKFKNSRAELWTKPAAENIFHPIESEKEYDIMAVGNWNKKDLKGLEFAFNKIPSNLNIVHVGISNKFLRNKFKHVDFKGWIPRREIPQYYAKSKMAVVTCKTVDSCPRVIPEALACGCPILVLERVNFWKEMYIGSYTGRTCSNDAFPSEINRMLKGDEIYKPYPYYKEHLSMDKTVDRIWSIING